MTKTLALIAALGLVVATPAFATGAAAPATSTTTTTTATVDCKKPENAKDATCVKAAEAAKAAAPVASDKK